MGTIQTIRGGEPPVMLTRKGRPACANGHPWRTDTTRWRLRQRPERVAAGRVIAASSGWERDCLICKKVSEGIRREQFKAKRRYV